MFCGYCGFKNEDGAVFCGRCGKKLEGEENVAHSAPSPASQEQKPENVQMKQADSLPPKMAAVPQERIVEPPLPKISEPIPVEKPKKKKGCLLPLILFFIFLLLLLGGGAVWGYLNFFKKVNIPLDGYLNVRFEGPSGYAKGVTEIDWKALEGDYGDKLHFTNAAKEDGISRKYDSPVDYLEEAVSPPALEKAEGISDGEQIEYKWDINEEELSSYLNCKFKYADKKVKAHIDEKATEEDIFKKIDIQTGGYANGQGHISLDDLPEGIEAEDFTIEPNSNLSNGDTVTISLTKDPSYYLEKCGILPSKTEMSYTVSGLIEETTAAPETAAPEETEAQAALPGAEAYGGGTMSGAAIASSGDYICSFSASRLITKQDVDALMTVYPNTYFPGERSVTQMVVNEMYARHGYVFKDQALNDYFNQYAWYRNNPVRNPQMDSIYPQMSAIEKQNVDYLKTFH